jgi:presenilin-like A22 family membrane protease
MNITSSHSSTSLKICSWLSLSLSLTYTIFLLYSAHWIVSIGLFTSPSTIFFVFFSLLLIPSVGSPDTVFFILKLTYFVVSISLMELLYFQQLWIVIHNYCFYISTAIIAALTFLSSNLKSFPANNNSMYYLWVNIHWLSVTWV